MTGYPWFWRIGFKEKHSKTQDITLKPKFEEKYAHQMHNTFTNLGL